MAKTEKEVGRVAAQMLKKKLSSAIQSSGLKMSNEKDSISRATTSYRMVRGEPSHLRGIAIVMPKHGFIQSHGVDGKRTSHVVRSSKGKFFARKQHSFKMKKSPIVQELLDDNTIVDYVSDEISRLRGDEFVLKIKQYLEAK